MAGGVDMWSWAVWTPIIITLLSGTVSSLGSKVVYDTPVDGTAPCGRSKFQKAYFFTLCMFIGEFMCLGLYYAKGWLASRKARANGGEAYQALHGEGATKVSPMLTAVNSNDGAAPGDLAAAPIKKPPIWVYAVLCCFDLSATSVGGVGLIWVDASTNQMLRGSMVVFCAIFSVLMLKRKLSRNQWLSIGIVCLGLGVVGLEGMLKKKYDPSKDDDSSNVSSGQLLLGIFLVLLASALNAVQNVFEEKLLKAVGGAEVDPLELVGWEGCFGSILAAFVLLPIVYYIPGDDCGRAEDSLNTLKQLSNSPLVLCLCMSFAFSLCLMNWTSQQISQQLSAIHRNLVSAVRTVLVWMGDIALYYCTKNDNNVYGEPWTNWSLLELAGFFLLVAGTVLYSYYGIQEAKKSELEALVDETNTTTDKHPPAYQSSPEYVVPIEPTLAEHQQVVKQQRKYSGSSQNGNGNGYHHQPQKGVYDDEGEE